MQAAYTRQATYGREREIISCRRSLSRPTHHVGAGVGKYSGKGPGGPIKMTLATDVRFGSKAEVVSAALELQCRKKPSSAPGYIEKLFVKFIPAVFVV